MVREYLNDQESHTTTVRTTLQKLRTGDALSDEDLKTTISVLNRAEKVLKLINNPAYRLVLNDISRDLDTMDRIRESRKAHV
jgi:DNA integrity scanning protein DisA with diadenylate cyclase activity